jgi:hypothetical protein
VRAPPVGDGKERKKKGEAVRCGAGRAWQAIWADAIGLAQLGRSDPLLFFLFFYFSFFFLLFLT